MINRSHFNQTIGNINQTIDNFKFFFVSVEWALVKINNMN